MGLRLDGEGRRPAEGLAGSRGEEHPVDVEALVLGKDLREVDLKATASPASLPETDGPG